MGKPLLYADQMLSLESLLTLLPPRPMDAHKGLFGHVLIIGGNKGMPGAVVLAAEAALRVGAGCVSVALHPQYASLVLTSRPEVMVHAVDCARELDPLTRKATVCLLGPGLGEDPWACALFHRAMILGCPKILDASALRLLAQKPYSNRSWVLTPHPGEAAALLKKSGAAVQAARLHSVQALATAYRGTIVLKGAQTLVHEQGGSVFQCQAGNPGMASPGMGDVLSGVIAGLTAQGLSLSDAAKLGVILHASAGDLAAVAQGQRGLLAHDLMPYLRQLVNAR